MEITIYRRHSADCPQKLTVTPLVADAPCRVSSTGLNPPPSLMEKS
jgi:hypothetical protein